MGRPTFKSERVYDFLCEDYIGGRGYMSVGYESRLSLGNVIRKVGLNSVS
jgi:hypothetical protein